MLGVTSAHLQIANFWMLGFAFAGAKHVMVDFLQNGRTRVVLAASNLAPSNGLALALAHCATFYRHADGSHIMRECDLLRQLHHGDVVLGRRLTILIVAVSENLLEEKEVQNCGLFVFCWQLTCFGDTIIRCSVRLARLWAPRTIATR